MAKEVITSSFPIESFNDSWEKNPKDNLKQSGKQVREFLASQHNSLDAKIGSLDNLTTTNKTSLVAAINEASQSSGLSQEQKSVIDELVAQKKAEEDAKEEAKKKISLNVYGGEKNELGTSVTPSAIFTVVRNGKDDTSLATIVESKGQGTVNGASWSAPAINSANTYTFVANIGEYTDTKSISYTFGSYLYQGIVDDSAVPATMTDNFIKSLSSQVISSDTTKTTTELAAGKCYIFACKGTIIFKLFSVSPDSVINGFTQGQIVLTRKNGTGSDTYSYIIVPASAIDWKFKITN